MKQKREMIIAIIAVILIIFVVVGATYAYWGWASNATEQTNITFRVPTSSELLSATLEGGGDSTVKKLAPAACNNATYAFKKDITLTSMNKTTSAAIVTATLSISDFTAPHATNEHPVSGVLSNLKYAITPYGATTCTSNPVVPTASFTTINGALLTDVTLATIGANTNSQTDRYTLWVWLDSSYQHTNYGNVISDPLQDISFTLSWSGTIDNTPTP